MKITSIEPLVCAMPIRHRSGMPALTRNKLEMLLVRITTDEGPVGWGEAFSLGGAWPAVRTALATVVAPRCIGRDPCAIQLLTRDVAYAIHQLGRSGSVMQAWSAVETALWDILGQSLGVPLHMLLGGAQVQQLGAYASLPRYGASEPVVQECERALALGFSAVKLHEITAPNIRAGADALGGPGKVELMVDVNAAWSYEEALSVLRQIDDIPLKWLEEPLHPADGYEAMARLRAECGVPIACGEAVSALSDFHTMLRLGAVDFVQPSVAKLGGVGAARRVFELVADTAVEAAPHTPLYGPALLASIHLCAALWPRASVEAFLLDLDENPLGVFPRAGRFEVPQTPGLGFAPDPEHLKHCLVD